MTKKRPLALTILWNLLLITVGCFLCAAAIKGILIPKEFLAGGVTGLSLLVDRRNALPQERYNVTWIRENRLGLPFSHPDSFRRALQDLLAAGVGALGEAA